MADFDYNKHHARAFYAPVDKGDIKKGEYFTCQSKDDEARAKDQGYTSTNYVPSEWPKTAYNKNTGDSRPVGRLKWSEEQNQEAATNLGPDWTLDHVPTPEPTKAASVGSMGGDSIMALASIMADMKIMLGQMTDMSEAIERGEALNMALAARIQDLEDEADAKATPPQPAQPAPTKEHPEKADHKKDKA